MFFLRVVVTILALIFALAGYDSSKNFELAALLLAVFWGIPILIFVVILVGMESLLGKMGPFVIALLGFAPSLLLLAAGHGNRPQVISIVHTNVAWSVFWILTYYGSPSRLSIRGVSVPRRPRAPARFSKYGGRPK